MEKSRMAFSSQPLVNEFVTNIQKRKIEGPQTAARMTAELLRSVISQQKVSQTTNQAAVLMDVVKSVGEQLNAANPVELAVGNIVRRVLHIIREEELSFVASDVAGLELSADMNIYVQKDSQNPSVDAIAAASLLRPPSLHALLDRIGDVPQGKFKSTERMTTRTNTASERSTKSWKLKHAVIEAVNELIEDINTCHEFIAEQAVELIHQNEVILTLGHSKTVMKFLCAAKEKRRSFRVFVAEGAPKYQGHVHAGDLVARGLQTTVIIDAAVYAMISRVNMVIVGVHAVMANGGVIGPVGLNMVALAARKHAVPFVVVAGIHKLCPLYPQNPLVLLNEMRSPSELLQFGEFSDCMDFSIGNGHPLLNVVNPAFDYVPPELINLFITETGGCNPSFIYRLIADYYSTEDLVLQKKTAS